MSPTPSSPFGKARRSLLALEIANSSWPQIFRQFCSTRATSSFLGDGEIAIINKDAVRVIDFEGNSVQPSIQRITWDPIMAEKGGFKHFMLKEIYEQPRSVRDTVQGRISPDSGQVFLDEMSNITESRLQTLYIDQDRRVWDVMARGTRGQVHD